MPFIIEQISGLKKKLDLVKKLVLTPTCKADCVNIIHYTFLSCKRRMEQNQGCFTKYPKLFFIITPLLIQSKSHLLNALTVFLPYQLLTFGKNAQNIPSILFTLFFKSRILILSIKTGYSAEDIFLSQRRVIAEIIHGFCHDFCTVARQYGYPQDVIGKLPDQRQIVL